MKRIVVAAMMAAFCLGMVAPAYAVRDYSSTARNIIPSGQCGAVPTPPQANDQAQMYDALTPLFDNVTNARPPPQLQVGEARHQGPGAA